MDQTDQDNFDKEYQSYHQRKEKRLEKYKKKGPAKSKEMEQKILSKLSSLMTELQKETSAICNNHDGCVLQDKSPERCCVDHYCKMIETNLKRRNVDYKYVKEPKNSDSDSDSESESGDRCRFLKKDGCVIEPHFRPICSAHLCNEKLKYITHNKKETKKKIDLIKRKVGILSNELAAARSVLGMDEELQEVLF